jgi:hypothetical protein
MSDLILDGSTDMIDIHPFRVERFAENDLLLHGEGYNNRSLS